MPSIASSRDHDRRARSALSDCDRIPSFGVRDRLYGAIGTTIGCLMIAHGASDRAEVSDRLEGHRSRTVIGLPAQRPIAIESAPNCWRSRSGASDCDPDRNAEAVDPRWQGRTIACLAGWQARAAHPDRNLRRTSAPWNRLDRSPIAIGSLDLDRRSIAL